MTMLTCGYCGYSWDSATRMKYVNCPSCRYNVRNPNWVPPSGIGIIGSQEIPPAQTLSVDWKKAASLATHRRKQKAESYKGYPRYERRVNEKEAKA